MYNLEKVYVISVTVNNVINNIDFLQQCINHK